tara:strand:+ start:32 stop:946 length:915 start_codon:yes stop_codon:yes gene_type:complete
MKLEKDWELFKKDIEDYVLNIQNLILDYSKSKTQSEYDELDTKLKELKNQIVEYLQNAFNDPNNSYAHSLKYSNSNNFSFGNRKPHITELIKKRISNGTELWKNLEYYLRILEISDAVIKPNEINLEERKNFDTDEKLELILEKLNQLYDDSYHSVSMILEGNGIELERYNEERELAKFLEDNDYIRCVHTRTVTAQITLNGRRYIENKRKKEVTDYSKINKSQEELNNKIDEIIDILKIQNFGQEILFNELEELKSLYGTLGKKNWGQVLKGKLVDLGLAQVINKEVMESIFKELTDQILLLK